MIKWDLGTHLTEKKAGIPAVCRFRPLEVKRTYGVVFTEEDESQKKTQIHYEIDIICLEEQQDEVYRFEVQKHPVFINEKQPNGTLEELVARCGAVIYPLQVLVNAKGKVLRISNREAIVRRWRETKEAIAISYKGETAQNLLEHMDAIIADQEQLTALLFQRDWFISLYFSGWYSAWETTTLHYPLLPYVAPVAYRIHKTVEQHKHKQGAVVLTLSGDCAEERSEKDILKGYTSPVFRAADGVKGKAELVYQTYENSPVVDAITGTVKVVFPSGKTKQTTVEIYSLKNKTPQTAQEKQEAQAQKERETPQPKQKKKKYFLFGKEIKFGK